LPVRPSHVSFDFCEAVQLTRWILLFHRGLIDRALDQKLTPKKAKFLFKKLLFVEDRIGDEAGKQRAKTKAKEWVLSQAKADEQ
jgi:hypothetical protein